MSLADIRARATRFQARIRWRNATEYAASIFVIGCFGWFAITIPSPIVQLGAAMIVLGTLYVCWKLYTLARAKTAGETDQAQAWAEFHRSELQRQRTALDTVWRWYLAPLAPGLLVFLAGATFAPDSPAPLPARAILFGLSVCFAGAVFAGVAWLNKQAVKTLDREIAALDQIRAA